MELEVVIVNEEYVMENPVWIIKDTDYDYTDLPSFINGEFSSNGVIYIPEQSDSNNSIQTKASGDVMYGWIMSSMTVSKQYDKIFWSGGSEFAALLGWSKDNGGKNFKYDKASYEECAEVIHRYVKAALIDIRRFYRIILFNFVTLNDDAHLKNFSLIERNGEYRLSPAYDLVNTSLQLYEPRIFALDKGLFKEGMSNADTHGISYDDFVEFGRRIGLTDRVIKQEIKMFQVPNPKAIELIEKSFLSDNLKKQYITAYTYRCKMLNF